MEKLNSDININFNEELINKMKEAYLKNVQAQKYLKDIGVPDEEIDANIIKIYSFVEDLDYCANCPGLDKCNKTNPHLCSKISYKDGFVDKNLIPCKKLLERINFLKQFKIRDFEDKWLDVSLKDLDLNKERKLALNKYNDYCKGVSHEWIYLTGESGSGRSYFASVITVDLARKNKGPICFLNSALRLNDLYTLSFKRKEEFKKQMDLLSSCPVLVIDDFGNEVKNDFVRDGILFPILQKRSSQKLFTILTSDFPIDDIVTLYSVSKSSAIRANQIGKLLKNNCGTEINLGDLSLYK